MTRTPDAARKPRWAIQSFSYTGWPWAIAYRNLVTPWFVFAWGRTHVTNMKLRCSFYAR